MAELRATCASAVAALALIALVSSSCSSTSHTDPEALLEMEEIDRDGDTTPVTDRPGIVDINSKIKVLLDRPAIANALRDSVGAGGPSGDTLAELKRVTTALEKASALLPGVRDALQTWQASAKTVADNTKLSEAFGKFGKEMAPIDAVVRGSPELRREFERRVIEIVDEDPDASQAEQERIVLELVGEWLQRKRAEVEEQAAQSGGYVRLGAWLDRGGKRSPVHLPGFDTVPEGEFYEVDRWKVAMTDDQKEQLKARKAQARAINAAGGDPKVLFDRWAEETRKQMQQLLASCIDEFQTRADEFATSQAPTVAAAVRLNSEAKDVVRLARRLRHEYGEVEFRSLSPEGWLELLHGLHDDFEELVAQWRELRAAFSAFKAAAAQVPAAAKPAFDQLLAGECITTIDNQLHAMAQQLGIARASADVEQFSDAVLKLDIGAVRESTQFDLRTTGMREAGDQILLRLEAGKRESSNSAPIEQTIASRELDLERVLPHLETTVGLIFANPDGSTALSSDFQAAPAYSILYKEGTRGSRLRNSLFDWGVGVNIAALDFDKDDTPELGFGLVVAALRNYVQLGYGYNPFEEEAYWFFSVNLPMGSWNLPGGDTAIK